MKPKIEQKELNRILKNHSHWLKQDCYGWEYMRANLCDANLQGINLSGLNLSGADLGGANLYGADLRRTNLHKANLHRANLRLTTLDGADLNMADLSMADLYSAHICHVGLQEANLRGADLCHANFYGANFYKTNLQDADLCYANFYKANFDKTNLQDADLDRANLNQANLRKVDLSKAKNVPFIPMACPEKGSFIGFKKAYKFIVELEICKDARRSSAFGRKCRCDKAKVLSITELDGSSAEIPSVPSDYKPDFFYSIGEIVEEPNFDDDRFNECARGIHFFINRQEAVDY